MAKYSFPLTKPFGLALCVIVQAASQQTDMFVMSPCNDFVIEEATIDQMQDAMSTGKVSSQQLLRTFQNQPYINSILEYNPDAPNIAATCDAERAAGVVRGPLHGIPFLIKDNIASEDRMQTTAGSTALLGSSVPRDAHVLSKLRAAGAELLGKAGLSEWADMRSNNYSEGYSARGGQCRSPYNFTVNPGGSSSGSAVAVAANAVAFALGTETDGSVINPAERNAVVGIKPTVGRTSRAGVVPESIHQDTVGTFGKTVKDAVLAFDAIWGIDHLDNYTQVVQNRADAVHGGTYFAALANSTYLANASFGIPWQSFWSLADDEQQQQLLELVRMIQDAVAHVINGTEIDDYQTLVSPDGWNWDYGTSRGYPNESEYTVVKIDFYNNISTYLSELSNTDMRSLQDIVDYNYANDGTEGGRPYPDGVAAFYSGQDGFLASLATAGTQDEIYWQALSFCQTKTRTGIGRALTYGGMQLDALLVPPDVGQTYQLAAQAGYPMITLPAGVHSESQMPFGVALMQTGWAEEQLIRAASAIEDLQFRSNTGLKRTLPSWQGYLQKNLPVDNIS